MRKEKTNRNAGLASCFARLPRLAPVLAAFALAVSALAVRAEEITGTAKVIEGDLIEVGGRRIRLYGIDAPEMDQTCVSRKGKTHDCGDYAKRHMAAMLQQYPLKCQSKDAVKDQGGGDLVAVCYLGFIDIGENIVFDGWALAYRAHGEEYARAEKAAKLRNQGLWRGTFVMPWDWRRGKR